MATYLMTWNPNKWHWEGLAEDVEEAKGGCLEDTWCCGAARRIQPGSRFFLIRLGVPPKGLVGSGWIQSRPYEAQHWALAGRTAFYVDIVYDVLDDAPIMPLEMLQDRPSYCRMHWTSQSSGIGIPDDVAEVLEQEWAARTRPPQGWLRERSVFPGRYWDGAARYVSANAYEWDPAARSVCLERYGTVCYVCGFDFGRFYGSAGEGLIQVHHVVPPAEVGPGYRVDPLQDLRPVCANCHAMIHRRRPPYRIAEVQAMVGRGGVWGISAY